MPVRGIRGATSVEQDIPDEVRAATKELLEGILKANEITSYEEIASAFFTTSADISSCFPAEAARQLGMDQVPLLCATEIPVPNSLPRCIRILLHVNTERKQDQIEHIYLREARKLRPDMHSAQ